MSLTRLTRKPLLTIAPERTIADAVGLLVEHRAGALAVTEGQKLVGIFSERDVMKRVVIEGMDPKTTRLADVMTTQIITATESTPINEAINLMSQHRIRHLPLVDAEGNLLGMVSLRYLLHDRLEELFEELRSLDAFIHADGPGG